MMPEALHTVHTAGPAGRLRGPPPIDGVRPRCYRGPDSDSFNGPSRETDKEGYMSLPDLEHPPTAAGVAVPALRPRPVYRPTPSPESGGVI